MCTVRSMQSLGTYLFVTKTLLYIKKFSMLNDTPLPGKKKKVNDDTGRLPYAGMSAVQVLAV